MTEQICQHHFNGCASKERKNKICTAKPLGTAILNTIALALTAMPNTYADDAKVYWGERETGNLSRWGQLITDSVICKTASTPNLFTQAK